AERATWAELDADGRRLAGGLGASGVTAGEVVALAMPTSLDLIGSILALQWIDAIPIVVDPSVPVPTTARRLAPLGARRILTGDDAAGEAFAASGLEAGVAGELRAAGGDAPPEPLARPEGIAFLQQTSGST